MPKFYRCCCQVGGHYSKKSVSNCYNKKKKQSAQRSVLFESEHILGNQGQQAHVQGPQNIIKIEQEATIKQLFVSESQKMKRFDQCLLLLLEKIVLDHHMLKQKVNQVAQIIKIKQIGSFTIMNQYQASCLNQLVFNQQVHAQKLSEINQLVYEQQLLFQKIYETSELNRLSTFY